MKQRKTLVYGQDTTTMPEKDMRDYHKTTAPVLDLVFFLNTVKLSPGLSAQGHALLEDATANGTGNRKDWYNRLTALQDTWRRSTGVRFDSDLDNLQTEANVWKDELDELESASAIVSTWSAQDVAF